MQQQQSFVPKQEKTMVPMKYIVIYIYNIIMEVLNLINILLL